MVFSYLDDKDESHYGLAGSATQVERIFPPEKNTSKCCIEGTPNEQSEELYKLIRSKKIV